MEHGFVQIHKDIFPTLFAISAEEQAIGLMEQPWPPPIMSFIYLRPTYNKFWMKNTPSPLDIVFCCDGRIQEICKGEPHSTAMISTGVSDLVIEFPYGTISKSNIKIGHQVNLVKPTFEELKTIIAEKYHGIIKN